MRFSVCSLVFSLSFLTVSAQPETIIELKTSPDYRLFITNKLYQAEWQIRIPEVIDAREGTFLTSVRPSVTWRTFPDGSVGYDWSGQTNYAAEVRKAAGDRIQIVTGLTISPRIKVNSNCVKMELTLKNISTQPLHDICADGGCLAHRTERFFDDHFTNSFIFTVAGLTSLSNTDRSAGIRAKYFFHPAWFESRTTKAYEFFWGRSTTRPAEALIVSGAREGKGAIGVAWDNCLGLRQNSDSSHRCMHSSPYFGDLKPGEAATRRGVIIFGDTVPEVVATFRGRSFRVYERPPADTSGD